MRISDWRSDVCSSDLYNGLYVHDVVANGGAEKAGIKKGDIITKSDGRVITASSVLQERVGRMGPGDKVELTYLRDGKEHKTTVTLQDAATSMPTSTTASKSSTQLYNDLGAGFSTIPADRKKELGISSGVVVSDVRRDGLFSQYGVPRGLIITSINGVAVNNIE